MWPQCLHGILISFVNDILEWFSKCGTRTTGRTQKAIILVHLNPCGGIMDN